MRSPIVVRFEGSGARLLCQATPYFEMIKVREVKCGDKKRVKLKKIIGVSKEDSDKLVGLTEVGLGTGLSKIGATISAEVGSQISVSECYEEEEETFYEVGKCDARTIDLAQTQRLARVSGLARNQDEVGIPSFLTCSLQKASISTGNAISIRLPTRYQFLGRFVGKHEAKDGFVLKHQGIVRSSVVPSIGYRRHATGEPGLDENLPSQP